MSKMKLVIGSLMVITLSACSMVAGALRVHTYLIPANMKPGWITIEYNNPHCAQLPETLFGREFVIPDSGYLCTSSSEYKGSYRPEYYLLDERKERTAISLEQILRSASFSIVAGSLDSALPVCNISGEQFFYGPAEKLNHQNPIQQNESFLRNHPECRQSGPEKVNQ